MAYIAPSIVRPFTNIPTIISSLSLERNNAFFNPIVSERSFAGFDYAFMKSFNNPANLSAGSLPKKVRQRQRIGEGDPSSKIRDVRKNAETLNLG